MKKILIALSVVALSAQAFANDTALVSKASLLSVDQMVALAQPFDLINWKVGDHADYKISLMIGGGTSTKEVTKDEGAAIWITQNMDLMGQKQKVEILLNKADGKVLKTIVNGQEQTAPTDPIEIISQDYTEVTVPAGTFKVLHLVAKTAKVKKIEIWANPKDIVMDGAAKQVMDTGMIGDLTMELTAQKHGQ